MSTVIREPVAADAEAIAALHVATWRSLFHAAIPAGPAVLSVAKEDPRAIAFYRRSGFAIDGAEQTDPGAPGIVEARMVR